VLGGEVVEIQFDRHFLQQEPEQGKRDWVGGRIGDHGLLLGGGDVREKLGAEAVEGGLVEASAWDGVDGTPKRGRLGREKRPRWRRAKVL